VVVVDGGIESSKSQSITSLGLGLEREEIKVIINFVSFEL
jgi:hypothetical protein